jgi:hypothetical protein
MRKPGSNNLCNSCSEHYHMLPRLTPVASCFADRPRSAAVVGRRPGLAAWLLLLLLLLLLL